MEETRATKLNYFQRHRHVVESVINLTGGTLGGVANVYVGQPLDTVKVKLQTFPNAYRNSIHCLLKTFQESGIKGLYAGTGPSLVANVAENAILFFSYGLCQKAVAFGLGKTKINELTVIENAVAGSVASFFSSLVLCPTELVKCQLQVMKDMKMMGKLSGTLAKAKHIGPSTLVRHILHNEGVFGLFHGLSATIAREMPGYFFFFGGYELSRTLLTPAGKKKKDLSSTRLVICGGLGGVAFWVSVFPTDVLKSRIQVSAQQAGQTAPPPYFTLLTQIIRKEGVPALYKGLLPTLVRSFFATAALFITYEKTKYLLMNAAFGPEDLT